MNKTQEALKLALDALETEHSTVYGTSQTARAITTIREVLAEQPAQQTEPCGWRMKHNGEWAYSFTKDAWDFIYAVSPAARKAARDNAPASKPKNVMQVKRTSDQSVELVFTSCAAASEFETMLREKNA